MPTATIILLSAVLGICVPCAAEGPPATETLVLSLKTISKALATCRQTYTKVMPGATVPLIKEVLGPDSYAKDMASLDDAERVTNILIAHPDRISGVGIFLILSASDDFAIGAASTQSELLRKIVEVNIERDSRAAEPVLVMASSLDSCQKALFNAGDDYVGLALKYVADEDRKVESQKSR